MKHQSLLTALVMVMAVTLGAAPQWSADEFTALVDGDDIIVDSKIAGTSSIIVLSNTIGMQGTGHAKQPKKNLYMVIERDYGSYDKNFVINLKPLLEDMEARGSNIIDLGFKFQVGDEIEIVGPQKNGKWWKYDDYDLDAVTPGFQPDLDKDDYQREGFNEGYGVDNYFQHYVDDDADRFNGSFVWTFGDGTPAPNIPRPDTGDDMTPVMPEDSIPQVSGQPLPGTLMTLLLGAGCIVTARKQKERKHRA